MRARASRRDKAAIPLLPRIADPRPLSDVYMYI